MGLMRISNSGRIYILTIVLSGVTVLPTKVLTGPREQAPGPSDQTTQSSSREPTSTPAKQTATLIEYRNAQYGFCFSLPQSWQGYSIVDDRWKGYSNVSENDAVVEQGPIVSIRHPEWTQANPRQDIPIMVFTLAQWRCLQLEEFHVSAAPIGPTELGRNRKYVFALAPRFDWAFPTGYEEVEQLLRSNSLHGGCHARGHQH